MDSLTPLDPAVLAVLGPIGILVTILLLGGLYIYFRFGQTTTRHFHEESTSKLQSILDELTKVNNRLATIEEWRRGWERISDERHERNEAEHGKYAGEIALTRDRVHKLSERVTPVVAEYQMRQRRERSNGGA